MKINNKIFYKNFINLKKKYRKKRYPSYSDYSLMSFNLVIF